MERLLEKLDDNAMTILPGEHEPRNIYRLLVGLVVPRPIAFVSSQSADGVRNLAPFSFFTVVCADPPTICFAPMVRGTSAAHKDTLRNIEATKEFVVNVVSEDFAQQMNLCSADFAPEVDEFVESGLTPVRSDLVTPPRVGESRASMECRLVQVIHVSRKRHGGSLVLGEVVKFHIRDDVFADYKIDPDRLGAIARMGGATYARTSDRFDMTRPIIPGR